MLSLYFGSHQRQSWLKDGRVQLGLLSLLGLGVWFITSGAALANSSLSKGGLSAGVSKTLFLPQGMYGQWQVIASLQEGAGPVFAPLITDFWQLQRRGDAVTLSNPVTGATASITVEQVSEVAGFPVASFSHISESEEVRITEHPTISLIQGASPTEDRLLGFSVIVHEQLKNGAVAGHWVARYRLEAHRLWGGGDPSSSDPLADLTARWRQGDTPKLEIAPIKGLQP